MLTDELFAEAKAATPKPLAKPNDKRLAEMDVEKATKRLKTDEAFLARYPNNENEVALVEESKVSLAQAKRRLLLFTTKDVGYASMPTTIVMQATNLARMPNHLNK